MLLTLSTFQTSAAITPQPLNFASDSAGTSLVVAPGTSLSGSATISAPLSFGFDTTNNTFFIQPGTITEGVTLAAAGIDTTATLGAADVQITGGSANVTATATVQLKDPLGGDTNNYITPAELSQTAALPIPLASIATTTLSGSAAATLPIPPGQGIATLVTGGSQTLDLTWGTLPGDPTGDISAIGASNLASLNTWPLLDTLSPALLQKAVDALPTIIQAATGSSGVGASIPVLGTNVGTLFNLGADFTSAITAASSDTSLGTAATALTYSSGGATSSVALSVNTTNNELDMLVTVSNTFTDVSVPYAIDTTVDGSDFVLNGTLQASGTATATLKIALSFDTSLQDTDRISVVQSGSSLALAFNALTGATGASTAALGWCGCR